MRISPWIPWLYAAPMMVFVAAIFAYPIVSLVKFSLQDASLDPAQAQAGASLANFRYILDDPLFRSALSNNLMLFMCVPIMLALSVILSAVLFERPRGWRIYRTLLFVPYAAWVAFASLLNASIVALN